VPRSSRGAHARAHLAVPRCRFDAKREVWANGSRRINSVPIASFWTLAPAFYLQSRRGTSRSARMGSLCVNRAHGCRPAVHRLRRLKVNLMTATTVLGLAQVLEPFLGCCDAEDLAKEWAARKPRAIKRVDNILAATGLTMDAVMAQTLSLKLDDIERIDRMIGLAKARRRMERVVNCHLTATSDHGAVYAMIYWQTLPSCRPRGTASPRARHRSHRRAAASSARQPESVRWWCGLSRSEG
jgi:hypothetical protein